MTRQLKLDNSTETEWIKSVTVIRLLNSDMFEFERIGRLGELFEQFFTDWHTDRTLINFNQIEFWNSLSLGFIASLPQKSEWQGQSETVVPEFLRHNLETL